MLSPVKKKWIRWQKLGGNRWRLECEGRCLVIVKHKDGTASLETVSFVGDPVLGTYESWEEAKEAAGTILE